MPDLTFAEGYNAFVKQSGAAIGASSGAEYVNSVETAIAKFADEINKSNAKIDNLGIHYAKGFIAEKWFAGTFNIDAAVKNQKDWANAIDNDGIVDIITSWGKDYQSKINITPRQSVRDLSITNEGKHNLFSSEGAPDALYYDGQMGIVASNKIAEIREILEREILRNKEIRPKVSENYQKVLDNLTDTIKNNNGAESLTLTEEQSRELVHLARKSGFDPKEWGLSLNQIKFEDLMRQAYKAGLSAALLSVVLKIAPEVSGIILKLIKDGEIDANEIKRTGFDAIKGGSEGFIRGSIAAGLTIACKQGKLGEAFINFDPYLISAITVFTLNAIKNSCVMASGDIDKREFAERCIQDLVVTVCSYGLGKAGEKVLSSVLSKVLSNMLNLYVPIIGYLIGSFVGSVIGSLVYKGLYSCVISFCVDSGCTFFGLVEQDYTLPKSVLESIGVDVFEYQKVKPKLFHQKEFQYKQFEYKQFEPLEISIDYLRRGVIAVGVIGYE